LLDAGYCFDPTDDIQQGNSLLSVFSALLSMYMELFHIIRPSW